MKSALLNYGESRETIRSAIQSAAIVEIPTLERRIGMIAALARVALVWFFRHACRSISGALFI